MSFAVLMLKEIVPDPRPCARSLERVYLASCRAQEAVKQIARVT